MKVKLALILASALLLVFGQGCGAEVVWGLDGYENVVSAVYEQEEYNLPIYTYQKKTESQRYFTMLVVLDDSDIPLVWGQSDESKSKKTKSITRCLEIESHVWFSSPSELEMILSEKKLLRIEATTGSYVDGYAFINKCILYYEGGAIELECEIKEKNLNISDYKILENNQVLPSLNLQIVKSEREFDYRYFPASVAGVPVMGATLILFSPLFLILAVGSINASY